MTKEKKDYQIEKKTMIHLIMIQQELKEIIKLLEGAPQKLPVVGAIIGGRIEMMSQMIRELNEDKKFSKRLEEYIKEINEVNKKRKDAKNKSTINELKDNSYMG